MEGLLRASGRVSATTKASRTSKQDEIWLGDPSGNTTCRLKPMDGLKYELLVHPKIKPGRKMRIDSEGEELEGVAWLKARSPTADNIALAVWELERCGVLKGEYLEDLEHEWGVRLEKTQTQKTYVKVTAKVTLQELRDDSWARREVRRLRVPEICFFEQEEGQDGKVWYIYP